MFNKRTRTALLAIMALVVAACVHPSSVGQAADLYGSFDRTTIFLGDSITEGFSYHDILPEENVLAGAGKTAQFALENVDALVDRQPRHVFIWLSSTDILWPTDNPQEYSLSHYAAWIDAIKAQLPAVQITVLSVSPVTAEAEQKEPRYANIEAYNEGLKTLAAHKQVEYVDVAPLVVRHSDLYDADGIHFKKAFYPHLLDFLND